MSAVTSPSEIPAAPRPGSSAASSPPTRAAAGAQSWRQQVHGHAEVTFARRAGADRLTHLAHHDPLRVLFPAPARGDIPLAALVNSSGGMVAGDRLDIAFSVGPGAHGMALGAAAEKIYRSPAAMCEIAVTLEAGEHAWLEWLPQETILFEGARLRRCNQVNLAAGARLLAGEMLIFGRAAHGEDLTSGAIEDRWALYREGRLVWADILRMQGELTRPLRAAAGLAGARAVATLIYAGPDAADMLSVARDLLPAPGGDIRVAASVVNGVLVLRWLGGAPERLRVAYGAFWGAMRAHLAGLPAALPRLWYI